MVVIEKKEADYIRKRIQDEMFQYGTNKWLRQNLLYVDRVNEYFKRGQPVYKFSLPSILRGHNHYFEYAKRRGKEKPKEMQRFMEINMKHVLFEREYVEYDDSIGYSE